MRSSTLKAVTDEIARALVVLAMFAFLLGVPAALAAAPPTVVQQASALLAGQQLCGHGQGQTVCHAPNSCCRPDLALPPPRSVEIAPPFGGFSAVVYAGHADADVVPSPVTGFRSRAPPV